MTTDRQSRFSIRKLVDVRPGEGRALVWAWVYIFCLLCSYSIIRPIRDEMGVAGGVENLHWLFTGTLLGMLAVNPAFAALVARLPRAGFISVAYRFFVLNLLLFFVLLKVTSAGQAIWVGRVFFIWTSIFNLFVVSVFWALMVDVFNNEQGKRLFGFIAAGATLGAIVGASATAFLAEHVRPLYMLLGSAVLLEIAVFSVRRLSRLSRTLLHRPAAATHEHPIGGSIFSGITHALKSPYLINVSLYILLYTITSTFLYFQQAEIARDNFADRGARTAFFARIDVLVNVLTLVTQLFFTSRILRTFGVALTLGVLPALSFVGFGVLALSPTIWVLVAFQVLRRAGNFAISRPAREVLFTVIGREEKYKAKSFIDTVVYRAGDQLGAWSYALLSNVIGLGLIGISLVALPIAGSWLINGLWLGRKQEHLAQERNFDPNG